MPRYTRIQSATFDGTPLGLPVSATFIRGCRAEARTGDSDVHPSSVQIIPEAAGVEIVCRDVTAPDGLAVGREGQLTVAVASADGITPGRVVQLTGAVLARIETRYSQTAPAETVLRFACESPDGIADPFTAEDQS
jgi:hypothetical protein